MLPSEVLFSESEENIGNIEIHVPSQSPCVPILQENHKSPPRLSSSPSYVEILKKKVVDSSGFSDEDSFQQSSKNTGRKSHKQIREEEAECLKMQGSQATIKMTLGRSKRNKPNKGGETPYGTCK